MWNCWVVDSELSWNMFYKGWDPGKQEKQEMSEGDGNRLFERN